MEAILASMGDAVLVVDRAGSLLRTNAAYDQLLANIDGPFIPQDQHGQALPAEAAPQARAARGESFSIEFTALAADGTRRWFEANGRPLSSHLEGGERGVVVIRDVTERSLRRRHEQFVGLAGHELRTPLTALQGYLQLHLRELSADAGAERLRGSATAALDQVRRLNALIDDLLDVTRLQNGVLQLYLEPLDLVPLASRMVELAQTIASGQTIQLEAAGSPLVVQGDAGRLEEVFLNLLTNAIKYAPGTDRIEVRVSRVDGEAEIAVQDHGPGISPVELPNIFARFYQVERTDHASRGGLGLGLFITRAIATAHGGRIDVASEEGKGTTFTVRLPILEGAKDLASTATTR
jgi:two-component system CheB/CheR fusion protein